METDPKGQLGGLECNDSVRRTMALQSRSWKCPACSKTNLEILTECEKEAALLAPEKKPDEAVPKELKMGWRDEMRPAGDAGPSDSDAGDAESHELAEGFVQTAPVAGEMSAAPAPVSQPQAAYPAARPVQGVPQPTATTPLPPVPQAAMQLQQQRHSNDGVPEWVDKAIFGVVACLIVMILKMILNF